jgi:hypothetical protein
MYRDFRARIKDTINQLLALTHKETNMFSNSTGHGNSSDLFHAGGHEFLRVIMVTTLGLTAYLLVLM